MLWLIALVSAITTAAIGLVGTGLLASACVSWFRISSFEGKSAYFVVGLALVGGVLGLLIGAIVPLIAASASERLAGWSSCLLSGGIAVATLLIATIGCRLLADVPPRLDGGPIVIEVEVRIADATPTGSPLEFERLSWITLASDLHGLRTSRSGAPLRTDEARREDGAWLIPGAVWPHTKRGRLRLEASLDGRALPSVASPLPGSPGREHLEWSEWMPWPQVDGGSSAGSIAYRVRIQPERPPLPAPTREEIERARVAKRAADFEALGPDAPIRLIVPFAIEGRDAALEVIARRPDATAELALLARDDDPALAADALRIVMRLVEGGSLSESALPEILTSVGQDLVLRIDRFNETSVEADPSFLGASDAAIRFSAWIDAARLARERGIADCAPELEAILVRSRRRPESVAMRQDICRVASHYLTQWTGAEPHPNDPPPR